MDQIDLSFLVDTFSSTNSFAAALRGSSCKGYEWRLGRVCREGFHVMALLRVVVDMATTLVQSFEPAAHTPYLRSIFQRARSGKGIVFSSEWLLSML